MYCIYVAILYRKYKQRMWKKNKREIELGNSEFRFSVLL